MALALALASSGCSASQIGMDGGSSDDLAASGTPAVPRLVAPLSMSVVTQQQPALRWVLGAGDGTPFVDLCRDRACTQRLTITAPVASDKTSAVPSTALPAGVVFWRVRVVVAGQTASSATWQFWVGKSSARNPVDTSSGTKLDVNGDGYADFVVGAPGANAAHLYLGSASGAGFQRIDLTAPRGGAFGTVAAAVGDINGDGYADFLVSAPAIPNTMASGDAYLYLGEATPQAGDWNGATAPKRIDLHGPDAPLSRFGSSAAFAGDVNGDGYSDFVVGTFVTNGGAHVYLGGATPSAADWNGASSANRVDLADPDQSGGFFGGAVASAGDVDGDGYADFLVGAIGAGTGGAAHLYRGEATPNAGDWNGPAAVNRIDLADLDGAGAGFGGSLASAGDVNGDGYSDFLIGAGSENLSHGAVQLYFGGATPSATDWNNAASAKRIDLGDPDGANAAFGRTVAGVGDVDGDGYGDFVVGTAVDAAHVYLGAAAPSASDWTGAAPARRIDLASPEAGANFGVSIAGGGDVDGDGLADFLIGVDGANTNAGVTHVYLGAAAPTANLWNGPTITKRVDLANPDGAAAKFGHSVASGKDKTLQRSSRRSSAQL